MNYDISPDTIRKAAQRAFGDQVQVSPPYWVDEERVRVGVALEGGNISFGANYDYRTGHFV
jgi:hypothetical protein